MGWWNIVRETGKTCVTQAWKTVVNLGVASLHLAVSFRMDSLPIVEGAVQAQYKGTMDGFLWQFFHFLLKPGLNSQFVPLNNSGCFIYFEFSSHCSCRSWPPPILTRLVALKMHPHHPYMYKGSSRDFLCYGSALALLRECLQWDVKRMLRRVCSGCLCFLLRVYVSLCVSAHGGSRGGDVSICAVSSSQFFIVTQNDRVLADTEKEEQHVRI